MFPLMIQILDIDAYRTEFLKGLMMSVGGMTENLVRANILIQVHLRRLICTSVQKLDNESHKLFGELLRCFDFSTY